MITIGRVKIAESESELIDGLFIGGGTADGFVAKRNKRALYIQIFGQLVAVNTHGVLMSAFPQAGGGIWHQVLHFDMQEKMGLSYRDKCEFAEKFSRGADEKGLIFTGKKADTKKIKRDD